MCGIAGIISTKNNINFVDSMKVMIAQLRHRGPDEFGIYHDSNACLGHARLSIIDLSTGSQPICNEDKSLWIIYNGEVFNYLELREILVKKGYTFYTQSDTEVILHGYEEYGSRIVDHLNGQFAFAIWNKVNKELFIARDRLGIRPLFYSFKNNQFIFSSEIKAILRSPLIQPELDPFALSQILTFWTTLYPRTIFKDVSELPPGHSLLLKNGTVSVQKYWQLSFPNQNEYEDKPFQYWSEQFKELLIDASLIRLRADVPVGAYLSGGLDSSVITSIIVNYTKNPMKTFSVSFEEQNFDESSFQKIVSRHLQTDHKDQTISNKTIAEQFPLAIWHTEKPILRTAPVPLMQLSRLVRDTNFKVVLTGEGADEMLGGYNIFKENMIRHFWVRYPNSSLRPLLLQKLYPYLRLSSPQMHSFNEQFFSYRLGETDHPAYSHLIRWRNYENFFNFFSSDLKATLKDYQPIDEISDLLPSEINKWDPLCKAQYIEIYLFMSDYLLSSQGDRMGMANSVEGRFPFLDHRLVEFCAKIPPTYKLRRLNEKYILKKSMGHLLPAKIISRSKQPYRAPVARCFYSEKDHNYVHEALNTDHNYFDQEMIQRFYKKWTHLKGNMQAERDNMLFLGILSTQLLHQIFISHQLNPTKEYAMRNINIINGDNLNQ